MTMPTTLKNPGFPTAPWVAQGGITQNDDIFALGPDKFLL